MPMRQTTSMKPLGATLLSLAVFGICIANENKTKTLTPSIRQLNPGSSASVTTVSSSTSISDSSASLTTVRSSKSISDVILEPVFQNTSLQQSPRVTTSPPSITARSVETNSTGKTESLPGNSMTAAPDSTWTTTDLNTNKTMLGHSKGHETISNTDGSPTAPTTRTSPTGTYAETISPQPKSLSTPENKSPQPKSLSTPENKSLGSSGSSDKQADDHYSSIILPVVIALIVITLSVFILVALYRMCWRTAPERQENGAEQAPTGKEGVKLLSVKTASPETVFIAAHDLCAVGFSLPSANLYKLTPTPTGEVSQVKFTGEHSSLGKNKTCQHDESSSHLGNKYM